MSKRKIKKPDPSPEDQELPLIPATEIWCQTQNANDRALYERLRDFERARAERELESFGDRILAACAGGERPADVNIPEDFIPEAPEEYLLDRRKRAQIIDIIVPIVLASPEGALSAPAQPLPPDWSVPLLGGPPACGALEPLECDAGVSVLRPDFPAPPYRFVWKNTLFVAALEPQVPYSLVRVVAARGGVLLASRQCVMELNRGVWTLEVPLSRIFGDGPVPDGLIDYVPIPATLETRSLFPAATVAADLTKIDDSLGEERARVEKLLELLRH